MCTPQGIIEHLGCMVFDEAVKSVTKAWKYVRHYKTNLQKLQTKMTYLEDRRKIIERKVNEAIDRDEVIEDDVAHWQRDTNEMNIYIQNLVTQSTDEAKMHCFACLCPNMKGRYRLSKQAEEKIVDVNNLIQSYNFPTISYRKPPPPELAIEKLQTEMTYLEDCRKIIEREVNEANDHGEVIEEDVSRWQRDTEVMKIYIQDLVRQSTDKAKMHLLSKQAEEKIEDVKKLVQRSKFSKISHHKPPTLELEFPSNKNYVNMDSRTPIFEAIMDALTRSNANIIGVHGLGGVGKTTLVKEIARKMLADGEFNQVALVTVSKDLNVEGIQKKLADELNLQLDATAGEKGKAKLLWDKLEDKKYLVILDDVWEKVDLTKIGIPIADGTKGCKVVLTSRKEDLLKNTMEVDKSFPIVELPEAEAWDLFKRKVGNTIESEREIGYLARKVCRKCKGLPVALNALGAALKGKPVHAWKSGLAKLERYMLKEIEGIDPSIWASLRFSYDMLQSSDARSCFLLCCLFPEDDVVPITELTRHCMARRMLALIPRTFDEARDAVCTSVDALKSSSLLSTGDHENVVTIHDVIRDVGISIACEEEASLVDHGANQWPRNPTNEPLYSRISLSLKNMKELPNVLVYPQLHTLMVHNSKLSYVEVPDSFFNGMTQLTVLTLTRMSMRQLPSSLAKLTNLRMLNLIGCELADIAILKDLKCNLEVLSLRDSSIEALPPEIGQLTSLRLLDLEDCNKLMVIPRGVISNLTKLEELYFQKKIHQFDKRKGTSSSWNLSLEELRWSLTSDQLTTLHIHIPDVMLLPKEGIKFDNLKRFRISVGSTFYCYEEISGTKVLKHEGSSFRNELIPLVENADALHLIGIKGLKKFLHDRGVGNGFLDLKYLKIESCDDDLEYHLGEPKSSVQSNALHPFSKLTVLIIEECKLKCLFSPTTTRGLVHLEQLKVSSCKIMEEIVGFQGQNDENELIFSKLKVLHLHDLPNLISFYAKKENTSATMGSSSARVQPLFNEKVILPVLEELEVMGLDSIEEIWDKQSPSLNEKTVSSQLMRISVNGCKKLMNLVPSNILPRLRNLQSLTLRGCPNIEFIVFKNGKEEEAANDSTLIIPQLRSLKIVDMKNLKSFYSSSTTSNAQSLFNHQVILPVLEELKVKGLDSIEEIWDKQSPLLNEKTGSFSQLCNISVKVCKKLMNLVPSNILPRLRNLQYLYLRDCPNVEFVVFKNGKEEEEAANDSTLIISQLRILRIEEMENLKRFYSSSTTSNAQSLFNHQVAFPALEDLNIDNVPEIKEIWDKEPLSKHKKDVESFYKLKDVGVYQCHQLECVFPSYMLPRLQNLGNLRVSNCKEMEVIISNKLKEEEVTNNDIIVFPQLSKVRFVGLPKLESFYTATQIFFSDKDTFPSLLDGRIDLDADLEFLKDGTSTKEEILADIEEMTKGWPKKVKHELHEHELELTRSRGYNYTSDCYNCNGCNEDGKVWSFYCEECDFDLHPNCALEKNKATEKEVSMEDAFPVLVGKVVDEDLEFLEVEYGTSTKEVSMEECGASGKENDHIGEEG